VGGSTKKNNFIIIQRIYHKSSSRYYVAQMIIGILCQTDQMQSTGILVIYEINLDIWADDVYWGSKRIMCDNMSGISADHMRSKVRNINEVYRTF